MTVDDARSATAANATGSHDTQTPPRRRDAAGTRLLLLDAARRLFAHHGYAATTVREIADEAGVNVALINRYFDSKEGLFGACLTASMEDLGQAVGEDADFDKIAAAIARYIVGMSDEAGPHHTLMMLVLRPSGDDRTERMRLGVLRQSGERIAAAAGWRPDHAAGDELILRGQLVLAASLGITLLRFTSGLEPLASATEGALAAPLRDLVDTLLTSHADRP